LEYQEGGARLIVRDTEAKGCPIRNRGGEALAHLLMQDRKIRALDIRESNISDNGCGHLCLAVRQTDQLEELSVSRVGHTGLEFLLGVVRRCGQLKTLRATVCDVPTLFVGRQTLAANDHDTSAYKPPKGEDEEEAAEEEDEEAQEKAQKALNQLKKMFAENDPGSDDEGGAKLAEEGKGASSAFVRLLSEFVAEVRKKPNLTLVECAGDAVPADLRLDLERAVEEHKQHWERLVRKQEEKGRRTANDVLQDQMAELRAGLESSGDTEALSDVAAILSGDDPAGCKKTHLDMRSFVNRRLFAALGEALFECQRFKSKENEAVATPQGEMAFIAMYIRKIAQEQLDEASQRKKGA